MTVDQIIGKTIVAAFSSLQNFSCELDNTKALIIETDAESTSLKVSLVDASDMPRFDDAICRVDWSWICGSKVQAIAADKSSVRFQLDKAGPLNISLQMWQGKPFLAFQPYRPAK